MYSHPCLHNCYRVTIAPIEHCQADGRRIYKVVACSRGILIEMRKIWPQPYDAKHWVLNLPYPRKVGTFINPRKALGLVK